MRRNSNPVQNPNIIKMQSQHNRVQSNSIGNSFKNICCPQQNCKKQQQVNVQKEKVQGTFFMSQPCEQCHKDIFYFPCKCGEIIVQEKQFIQGYIYKCPVPEKCNLKQIQLFMCGVPQCKAINMFTGNYKMGEFLKCCACNQDFQQVGCPICFNSMYFLRQNPYKHCNLIKCYNCQNSFQHYNCFTCNQPLYSIGQKFKPLERDNCHNCKGGCHMLECPFCHNPNYRMNANPFVVDQCNHCQRYFQFFDCPKCKKPNENYAQYKGMDNGKKTCSQCKHQFNVLSCLNCNSQIIQEKVKESDMYSNEKITISCNYCKQQQLSVQCHKCENTYGISDVFANAGFCKKCNTETQLQEGRGKSQMLESQLKMEKSNSKNEDEDKLLCKICFDEKACFIFSKCGHLTCCESCVGDMKGKCPLCRVESPTIKIFI